MSIHKQSVVAVAVTKSEAHVWSNGIQAGSSVTMVPAPREHEHRHLRTAQHGRRHDNRTADVEFYEKIAAQLYGATMTVLVGHGRGKANAMKSAVHYWERKHPDLSLIHI